MFFSSPVFSSLSSSFSVFHFATTQKRHSMGALQSYSELIKRYIRKDEDDDNKYDWEAEKNDEKFQRSASDSFDGWGDICL